MKLSFISLCFVPMVHCFLNKHLIHSQYIVGSAKSFSGKKMNIFMKNKSLSPDLRNLAPVYKPKTQNQIDYTKYLNDQNVKIILGVGPAGSGKTLFACISAINELRKGNIQKIILTRPVVTVEEDIGFLPGNLIHKMDPWTRPIFDIFLEYYSQKDIDLMVNSGTIEISPLAFMRGRTFKKSFIIADEMQNSSPNQMMMLTTRIGTDSKMVITGDLAQSDRGTNNGLYDLLHKLKRYSKDTSEIKLVELDLMDIERSKIVATMIDIYEDKGSQNSTKIVPPKPASDPVEEFLFPPSPSGNRTIRGKPAENDAAMIPITEYSISRLKKEL